MAAFITASSDRSARIWDAATAKEIAVLRGHENIVTSGAFSPDGTRIVTASSDKSARILPCSSLSVHWCRPLPPLLVRCSRAGS